MKRAADFFMGAVVVICVMLLLVLVAYARPVPDQDNQCRCLLWSQYLVNQCCVEPQPEQPRTLSETEDGKWVANPPEEEEE